MRNPRRTVFTFFIICILLAAYLVYHNANKLRYNEEGTIGTPQETFTTEGSFVRGTESSIFPTPRMTVLFTP